jgi:leucyl-tRNA synthetase
MPRYNPAEIEPKWQQFWAKNDTFRTPEMPAGEKLYVLDMFPYPSGEGLHVGHPEGYTATDIVCRFERMRGKTVLHPMGFDAFGLPAEEYAIKTNTPPRVSTEKNIARFTEQLQSLGFSYDWNRVISTTDVDYFRWTQWIFLVLFDTWFDAEAQRGRPISELPIPADVQAQGEAAVRKYQDEHRLAYQSDALVNWCPGLGTVLANEEVIDGKSERGGHPVVRMPLRQWMLRITAYGDRLANDLEGVDWSESIKKLQRDWIGRSTGAEVDFFVGTGDQGPGTREEARSAERGTRSEEKSSSNQQSAISNRAQAEFELWKKDRTTKGFPRKPGDEVLRIYTTRPDTLFGATYMVIAPEHPFVSRLTTPEQKGAVEEYVAKAATKSDMDRADTTKKKTGVFTGSYAINPVNGKAIPIWIADYVLISYGTGAIMAVPAHDERDYEFAETFDLPVVEVVEEEGKEARSAERGVRSEETSISNPQSAIRNCFSGDGIAVNSGSYNGLTTPEFKQRITADLAAMGVGREAVNYKLRDWLFSRQRFWGEPFPILHELDANGQPTGMIRALEPKDLPVDLPHLDDYKPHGRPEPPLAKAPEDWLYVTIDGKRYRRETNTMPQWAGSCWYYLRFIDPKNSTAFVDREKEKAWMPVDLYVGGAEHAVLHLLYARFWHKVLFDRGYVSHPEPFQKLVNQGMILGENGEKMSKSRGNVVNPDEVVRDFGADSLRLYEMFMGPLEATKPWSMQGVSGVRNFLDRAWRLLVDDRAEQLVLNESVKDVAPTDEQNRVVHKTIQAVTRDLARMDFNTGIARLMEFVNFFTKQATRPRESLEKFVLLLSPYAPHIAEELWQLLGHSNTLAYEAWPVAEERWTRDEEVEVPVQILGKLRGKVVVPAGSDAASIEAAAKADPKIAELLTGKTIVKTVVVPGRLVNFVVK